MFKDPVFQALDNYKQEHQYDVIRHEYAVVAEIARCHQYRKTSKTPAIAEAAITKLESVLEQVRELRAPYLSMRFDEYLKTLPWWKRRSVRANPSSWKYLYYHTARKQAVKEILSLIDEIDRVVIMTPKAISN